jgi:hypothetical protein
MTTNYLVTLFIYFFFVKHSKKKIINNILGIKQNSWILYKNKIAINNFKVIKKHYREMKFML